MMDAKSEDSAGSDSLDKSLQKKCVVEDAGQGGDGNSTTTSETTIVTGSKPSQYHQLAEGEAAATCSAEHAGIVVNHPSPTNTNSAKHQRCKTDNKIVENSGLINLCNTSNIPAMSADSSSYSSNSANSSSDPSANKNNNAFETKVTQISKNLKETTLAETASSISVTGQGNKEIDEQKTIQTMPTGSTTESISDSSSSSPSATSSSSSTTTPESEILVTPSVSASSNHTLNADCASGSTSSSTVQMVDLDNSVLNVSVSDSNDEHDNRSKKVRFHPDVKENDGGNRVIPKKKKKLKSASASGDDPTSGGGQQTQGTDDEMELDEDEECEEEDEFDLAKTIAEAQDYLKEHPLTFVRPCDKNAGLLQNGLLEEDDLPQLSESSEEEDLYENVLPENGIERILGKQNKCGKVEFLLRYADRPELVWETEEIINKQCPSLLHKYEQNRERRQERLMRHVAKRQNLRQRYTDF